MRFQRNGRAALILFTCLGAASGCDEQQDRNQSAPVESFEQLVSKHHCLACHAAGNQMGLPVWHEVAKKYQNTPDTGAYLRYKIKTGGSGAWGKMDMPPYQEIEEPELNVIVQGVLNSVKPKS